MGPVFFGVRNIMLECQGLWDNGAMEKAIASSPSRGVVAAQPDVRQVVMVAGMFLGYILLDWLTCHFPGRFGNTPYNPEAGLAVVLLMLCGLRYVPLVFIAVAVGEFVVQQVPRPFFAALVTTALLTGSYAAIAALLTRRLCISVDLSTRRDVMRLIIAAILCMLLCGFAYVGTLMYFGVGGADARYFYGVRRFVISYSASVLVTAPLILMLFSAARRAQLAAFFRSIEAWLIVAVIVGCVSWMFIWLDDISRAHNFYMLFLPLVWAATRFGTVGAAFALVLIQIGLFMYYLLSGSRPPSVFEMQLLVIALAITGLLLGVTIDEQRRASADFRESLKLAAAGEMAAAIAHEINQPLTALSAYATAGRLLAQNPALDRVRLTDTMDKLMAESKRAADVVRRLRDFFRSGATRLERIALNDLVARVMARLAGRAQSAGVALNLRGEDGVPAVMGDVLQIEVVLRNLIINAIDSAAAAADAEGRVDIALSSNPAGYAVVCVRDNGAGIAEADADRLFAPFVTTKTSGMGMGLAISRAIIDAHGGRIWAVPGTAGEMCFTLPPANAQARTYEK